MMNLHRKIEKILSGGETLTTREQAALEVMKVQALRDIAFELSEIKYMFHNRSL